MCLAIAHIPESNDPLLLGFNRDERPIRQFTHYHESPNSIFPAVQLKNGAIGTWIGVREGVSIALLNYHNPDYTPVSKAPSRGLIIPNLLQRRESELLQPFDHITKLSSIRPFQLLVYDRFNRVLTHNLWNGRDHEINKTYESGTHFFASLPTEIEDRDLRIKNTRNLLQSQTEITQQSLNNVLRTSCNSGYNEQTSPSFQNGTDESLSTHFITIDKEKTIFKGWAGCPHNPASFHLIKSLTFSK